MSGLSLVVLIMLWFGNVSSQQTAGMNESGISIEVHIAISNWFTEYARAVDRKQWDSFNMLFTDDAYLDYRSAGGKQGDLREIQRWLQTTLETYFPQSQHFIGNIDISQQNGTHLQAQAMYYNPMNMKWFPIRPAFVCGGWYHHNFTLVDGRWKSSGLFLEEMYSTLIPTIMFFMGFTILMCIFIFQRMSALFLKA